MTSQPVPVVVLASTDPIERDVAIMTALLDHPRAVAVVHDLHEPDDGEPTLERRVIRASGADHVVVPMQHPCAGCAMREDAVPALVEQLDDDPSCLILGLPLGAELLPATRTLTEAIACGALRGARLAGTGTVVQAGSVIASLSTGDDAVPAHLVGADVVVVNGDSARGLDVIDALRTPESVVAGDSWIEIAIAREHDDAALERWCDPETMGRGHGLREAMVLPGGVEMAASGVWQLELHSPRPFHPRRLLASAPALGAYGTVSRGRFWLPNRPGTLCAWDAVSAQVSIGAVGPWRARTEETYLHVVGFDSDPNLVRAAFESALLTVEETALSRADWRDAPDPLVPYLGQASQGGR